MKRIITLFLLVPLALLTFVSCNVSNTETETTKDDTIDPSQICGTYARRNDFEIQDYFTITLNADGTYMYYATLFSSHIGAGEYTISNNVITLVDGNIPTMDGQVTNTFRFEYREGKLIFLASASDKFMYVSLPEGAEFCLVETTQIPNE
ncbi:MAG: hypothetical protein IJC64_02875 [Clostridia bacterium]|nr:hypothetical protein [Clostridia bacterium]